MPARTQRPKLLGEESRKPGLFVVGFAIVFGLVIFFVAMSVITHRS
jgi:hypothetical protein